MTRCDTCRSTQGPFDRTVLAFNNGKAKRVIVTCRAATSKPEEVAFVRRACLARRSELDETGELMGA